MTPPPRPASGRPPASSAPAMTLSSTVEAKLRGRGSSTTPATAVANTLGVEPKSDNHEQRLNNIAHWGYGTSLGMLRGLLAVAGLSGPAAAGAHLGSVYAMEQIVLSATGASPPAWTWGAKELAVDLLHHVVYVGVISVAFEWLDRR